MREPSDHKAKTPTAEAREPESKKPYRTPRLVTYGSLAQLALANKGGTKNDGGVNSKA